MSPPLAGSIINPTPVSSARVIIPNNKNRIQKEKIKHFGDTLDDKTIARIIADRSGTHLTHERVSAEYGSKRERNLQERNIRVKRNDPRTFSSYFNPCSSKHSKANQKFKKLTNCEKALIIFCTALAALASCFILGIAGAAVYRLLVYKWSKVSLQNPRTSLENTAEKIDTTRQTQQEANIRINQSVNIGSLGELERSALKEAQERLIAFYHKNVENEPKIFIWFRGRYIGFSVKFDPTDFITDFLIRTTIKDSELRNQIPSQIRVDLKVNCNCLLKDFIPPLIPANLYYHTSINIYEAEENRIIPNVDNKLLKKHLNDAYLYFVSLLKLSIRKERLIPNKIKETVDKLEGLTEPILKYYENQFFLENDEKIKTFLQYEGLGIRGAIHYLTYPLKLFLKLYEPKVLLQETLSNLPTENIDEDLQMLRKEIHEEYEARTKTSPLYANLEFPIPLEKILKKFNLN